MKLIVTGTGRSGTVYMQRLFNELGVPCGHEEVFTIAGVGDWGALRADSGFCALPYLNSVSPRETVVYHVLRDPAECWISQLSSHCDAELQGGFWSRERDDEEVGPWLDFIHDNLDFGELKSPHSKSIYFMYEWTARINFERKRFAHNFTNQLENLKTEDLKQILQLLGVEPPDDIHRVIESVDIRSNSRPRFFARDDLHLEDPKYLDLRRFYDSI